MPKTATKPSQPQTTDEAPQETVKLCGVCLRCGTQYQTDFKRRTIRTHWLSPQPRALDVDIATCPRCEALLWRPSRKVA